MVVLMEWIFKPCKLSFITPHFPDDYLSESDDDYGEEEAEEEKKSGSENDEKNEE